MNSSGTGHRSPTLHRARDLVATAQGTRSHALLEQLSRVARTGKPTPESIGQIQRAVHPQLYAIYFEVRIQGRRHHSGFLAHDDQMASALMELVGAIDPAGPLTLLLDCFYDAIMVQGDDQDGLTRLYANSRRGLQSCVLLCKPAGRASIVSGLQTISTNRRLQKSLANFASEMAITDASAFTLIACTSEQYRLSRSRDLQWSRQQLFRGGRITELAEINQTEIRKLYRQLADYLVRSVRNDGRLVYMHYPSRGAEDKGRNNAIRQWMGTLALCTLRRETDAPNIDDLIASNIRYNLAAMYTEENSLGCIDDRGSVKLGAVALAALALHSAPMPDDYRLEIDSLEHMVSHLWQASGEFRTFYRPAERREFQNFYSGEALLLWANRFDADASLRDKFMASFRHYRDWHRAQRNPAFIPWHSQAYFRVWQSTGDEALKDFIFEMNDWLLAVQQWDQAPTPDMRGRFFDPDRPFGPPHASSTGVYLEGLADAFTLARATGDDERMANYRKAIRRGLRSVHQLTFKDDADMYYIGNPQQMRGGVRTTVYDNVVRVDNVQHNLLALHKIRHCFTPEDFEIS